MKEDYVSIIYDKERIPETGYPFRLAVYLFNRFKMREGQKLLEIGCGRGEFLKGFQGLGLDCDGVDKSDYCLKEKVSLRVKCLDISCDRLPFADNSFDIVYHKSVLEHFYNPENLMNETYRILKPGGRVIILTPDWVSQVRVFYEDFTHCRPYDIMSLSDLLKAYGFSEVSTELFYQLPILWKYQFLKAVGRFFRVFLSVPNARKITQMTRVNFFRWSTELMILGTATKHMLNYRKKEGGG